MPKSINLGNGRVLIGLDKFGQVKDFYFHYPGLENHIGPYQTHKIGVFVDGSFSWIDDFSWNIVVGSQKDTMASNIVAQNDSLGLKICFTDCVYNERDIFIRELDIYNLFDKERKVTLYFNQQFNISQTNTGDTAYYDPRDKVIIHYKGRRVFLINALCDGRGFDEYSVGLLGIEGKDGTYKDAEDGKLSGNPIEHGQVDSVIGVKFNIQPRDEKKVFYFICIAKSIEKAKHLNEYVLTRHPKEIINSTLDYWKAWVTARNFSFYGLSPQIIDIFNKSLLYLRTHVGYNGAIIASGDSDLLQYGRDTYAYVWPRDASFCAIALEKAGDFNASKRFFEFARSLITSEGFFMHKYRPDKSLGSSWHPWISNEKKHFPIQEDETAEVIYALWQHYVLSKDLEFIEEVYNDLIKRGADFMVSYRDEKTGLPKASYDLWEQDYGIHTFTASAVYGALVSASRFAKLLGKEESERKYQEAAESIKSGIIKYLYDTKEGIFYKYIKTETNFPQIERKLDMSSGYGIFRFGVLPPDDLRVRKFIEKVVSRLEVKTEVGGIARYENDAYHHRGGNIPGNPWVITTMWLAQYYIEIAKKESDMEPVRNLISWAVKRANSAGVLAEQYDPYTGEHISASPLAWSHAEFVTTIVNYLQKLEDLGVCKACYPIV